MGANYRSGKGNAQGVLTLDFAAPTSGLQFGVSRLTTGPMSPGLQVSLFDASLSPLGSFDVNTTVFLNSPRASSRLP